MVKIESDGQPMNDRHLHQRWVNFTTDGKMQWHEGDDPGDAGFYELRGEKTLIMYTDDNHNGRLDQAERENFVRSGYSRNGELLILKPNAYEGNAPNIVCWLRLKQGKK